MLTRRSTRSGLGPEVVAKKIEAKLLAHHGVKREVRSPALAAGPAGAGSAGTARPMAPQPKAQSPDKRR